MKFPLRMGGTAGRYLSATNWWARCCARRTRVVWKPVKCARAANSCPPSRSLPELDALALDLASCRTELRRIVSGLAPTALGHGDVGTAIAELVASFDGGQGPLVRLVTDIPDRIDARASVLFFRAIAEGITHAIKHAHATEVLVAVERDAGGLRVCVVDDGIGGPTVNPVVPGVGLESLRSRATEVGATLSVEPAHPKGTQLILTVDEGTHDPGPGRG